MRYLGNKSKFVDVLLPYMQKEINKADAYIEPFCGSCGMAKSVNHPNRICYDANFYLIALLKAVRDGWIPPTEVHEPQFNDIKAFYKQIDDPTTAKFPSHAPPELIGFVLSQCVFGSIWAGTFGRTEPGNPISEIADTGSRGMVADAHRLEGIDLRHSRYQDIVIPDKAVLYCDPPYNTDASGKGNSGDYSEKFDSPAFYDWVREQVAKGTPVFISEYSMPDDFICIHEEGTMCQVNKGIGVPRVEKLFLHKSQSNLSGYSMLL